MPPSEKDFRDLSKEVAALRATIEAGPKMDLVAEITNLKTTVRFWGKLAGTLATIATAAGLGAIGWSFHINSKVDVLESGGNPKLVTRLYSPPSAQQLSADLSSITAQVQQAEARGSKPNIAHTQAVSAAVSAVLRRDPGMPEAWSAASALISFRQVADNLPALPPELDSIPPGPDEYSENCYQRPLTDELRPQPGANLEHVFYTVHLHDCTLNIGDLEAFEHSVMLAHARQFLRSQDAYARIALVLLRVTVVYHGGSVIPISEFTAYRCIFDFEVPSRPPKTGEYLVRAVLEQQVPGSELSVPLPLTRSDQAS